MRIHGTPDHIIETLSKDFPGARDALARGRAIVPPYKNKEVYEYQGAVLHCLSTRLNRPGAEILEIGTAWGYSAALMALGAPLAHLVTMTSNPKHANGARLYLALLRNVQVVEACSWDYLAQYTGPKLDMIFVDGDHVRVRKDLPWWNWLNVGGLMVFHDYAPATTPRPCPPVYEALNHFAAHISPDGPRSFDVEIIDHTGVGLVGLYRREGETWTETA